MHITIVDSRALSGAIADPSTGTWYEWETGRFSAPFSAAVHLKPLAPMEPPPSPVAAVLTVDMGRVVQRRRRDLVSVLFTVDSTGNATPVDGPASGGFSGR